MRRATCPTTVCGDLILFSDKATHVHCRICENGGIAVGQLRDVIKSDSFDEENRWANERLMVLTKSGQMGEGKLREMRRSIDGLENTNHCSILWPYFESY